MEIKKKLMVRWERDNGGKKRKGQGMCIKDPWTRTMVGRGLNVGEVE